MMPLALPQANGELASAALVGMACRERGRGMSTRLQCSDMALASLPGPVDNISSKIYGKLGRCNTWGSRWLLRHSH